MNIEFTDRYGGNPPSWLRGCHGECEAVGFYPEPCSAYEPPEGGAFSVTATAPCPRPSEHLRTDFDGWHFLRCPDCEGTGRVPWHVSLARIPQWLNKGASFFWMMSGRQYQPPHFTYWQHIWLVFKCAFVYDLMRAFR